MPPTDADSLGTPPQASHPLDGPIDVAPTLQGDLVRLEPLTMAHAAPLAEVAFDGEIDRWYVDPVDTPEALTRWIADGLAARDAGTAIPFVIVERASGRAIGSTRYANLSAKDRRVEIGWTWVAAPWQRTGVNTEAKWLLLTHAFDVLGARRVELKTDVRNLRSRAAIARIGGVEEGTLRRHTVRADGTSRDTVYFSILDHEWPAVRARLDAMRRAPRQAPAGAERPDESPAGSPGEASGGMPTGGMPTGGMPTGLSGASSSAGAAGGR